MLLEQHLNLVVPNGTQAFGRPSEQNNGGGVSRSEGGGVEGRGDREGRGGGGRKEVGKMPAGMDHKHIELKKVDERPANGLSRKLLEATMVGGGCPCQKWHMTKKMYSCIYFKMLFYMSTC